MKNRILIAVFLLMSSVSAWAYDFQTNGLRYTITSDSTVAVTGVSSYSSQKITIPETVSYQNVTYSVTSIGDWAFEGYCDLNSISIPNSVVSIGLYAFMNCGLESLSIPSGIKSISYNAFNGCNESIYTTENGAKYLTDSENNCVVLVKAESTNITDCKINNKCKLIFDHAFRDCSNLSSIVIPTGITSIGEYVFYECENLTSVTIPDGITSIGESAFDGCSSLTSVTIPNGVSRIGDYAFDGCNSLTSISVPESITSIGEHAFRGCNDSLFFKENNAVYIGNSDNKYMVLLKAESFKIKSCNVNNNCKVIADYAFENCASLKTVTVPANIIMGSYVFYCSNNATIYCCDTVIPASWSLLWNKYSSSSIVLGCKILKVEVTNEEYGEANIEIKNGNSVTVSDGSVWCTNNTKVELTAKAEKNYHFVGWSDSVTDNPYTLTVTQDSLVIALFEAHIIVIDSAIYATCTKNGLTEGSHCSICGETIVEQTIIYALGHEFVDYVYNNDATIEADGTETAVCEHGCGETYTRVKEGTKLATVVTESAANAVNIYAYGRNIVVENAAEEIRVYDAMGRLVCRDAVHHVSTITVNGTGVYIVKVGDVVKRVVVR